MMGAAIDNMRARFDKVKATLPKSGIIVSWCNIPMISNLIGDAEWYRSVAISDVFNEWIYQLLITPVEL